MTPAQRVVTEQPHPVTVLPALPEPNCADEVHHRIANSLQLLAAMVSAEARSVTDPAALAVLEMIMRRIIAVAGVQRMLYQPRETAKVDLAAYLEDLGVKLGEGCGAGIRVSVSAESIEVSAKDATALGVIVAELVGNACKYAYPTSAPGDVFVGLRGLPLGGYVLEVSDRGAGMSSHADPQGTGLGSRVIAMTAQRLGGYAVWKNARPGTRFELHVGKC